MGESDYSEFFIDLKDLWSKDSRVFFDLVSSPVESRYKEVLVKTAVSIILTKKKRLVATSYSNLSLA